MGGFAIFGLRRLGVVLAPQTQDFRTVAKFNASTVLRAAYPWECGKVGGSVPPILTDDGWLLIYHAVETFPDRPFIYRAGAALDRTNPSQVIARLPYPILESHDDRDHLARIALFLGGIP
jgi:predicted GH43/DUF377 family glycosyl hydrolase